MFINILDNPNPDIKNLNNVNIVIDPSATTGNAPTFVGLINQIKAAFQAL